MAWSPQQASALALANKWFHSSGPQVFRLFGYAGTGKTTLAKHLAEGIDGDVLFAAYTGKAAHVLQTKGCPATTIHSLIYHSRDKSKTQLLQMEEEYQTILDIKKSRELKPGEQERLDELQEMIRQESDSVKQPLFIKNPDSDVKRASLVIIDECSMVDAQMGEDLLSFGTKVLVLGDPAQLPPVKSKGYFTEGVEPDVMLTEIHRQAQESGIIRLATMFRNKENVRIGEYGHDCRVINLGDVNAQMVDEQDQLIVGRNRTRNSYNHRMRQIKGIVADSRNDPYPTEGDRVICLRNNNEVGLLNGAMFNVVYMGGVLDNKVYMQLQPEGGGDLIEVSSHEHFFIGRGEELQYWERKDAEEFDYGYAVTCHKSQGSQWDKLLTFDESFCFKSNWHRWAYTAATRAAKDLTWALMPQDR